jgi:hypothetical protein
MELRLISGHTLAQSSALPVEYMPLRLLDDGHVYITFWIGRENVGFHAGERSGELLRFSRLSDASRFCARRNRAEKCVYSALLQMACHVERMWAYEAF